jgi:lysophospholipase L1-like esterase
MKHSIVLLGDSLTAGGSFPRTEALPGVELHNLGLPGETTWGLLSRLHDVWDLEPEYVFLMIGVNDLAHGERPEDIVERHKRIWESVKSGGARLVLEPLLPVNPGRFPPAHSGLKNKDLYDLNFHLESQSLKYSLLILDFRERYFDPQRRLRDEFTLDGLHLLPEAYAPWDEAMRSFLEHRLKD